MKKVVLFSVILLLVACCSNKKQPVKNVDLVFATPDVVVYKTTNDYTNNIAVIMDAERTRIVRYPAPADLRRGNEYVRPIQLENGYLLDCYGITKNVVFLDYTIEQYANFPQAPTLDEMLSHIIDKNPLVELWNCGKRTQYKTIEDVNVVVKSNFENCKNLIK